MFEKQVTVEASRLNQHRNGYHRAHVPRITSGTLHMQVKSAVILMIQFRILSYRDSLL